MNKILGLDLGTNSIGWAIVDSDTTNLIGCGARVFPSTISRQQKRIKRRVLSRNNYRNQIIERYFHKNKYSPILTSLTALTTVTFILSFINNSNWQFWLNICLTALLTTLTLIHQDKEK
jgi:CRISPR/Cas system Type II protein with McrA/HNH and RuvC-like nuclease domain